MKASWFCLSAVTVCTQPAMRTRLLRKGLRMDQKATFEARLQRLATHAGNTNATLHIGMSDQLPGAAFARKRQRSLAAAQHVRPRVLTLVLAVLSGVVAWVWAHWMRVSLVVQGDPLVALVADLSLGMAAVLLLRAILGLNGRSTMALQLVGMCAAILLMHNAVHLWPHHFAQAFPAAWVTSVLHSTVPLSVNLSALSL